MWLKLRELWDECEKMPRDVFNAFVEGLHEIVDSKLRKQDAKPCVAEKRSVRNNRGRWEPQEDDLLHKCISSSCNPNQGFAAFANDPANRKRRTKEAAQQRYHSLVNEGRW